MGNERDIKMSVLEEIMDLMDGHTYGKLKKPGAVEMSTIAVDPEVSEEATAALADKAADELGSDDEAAELMKMYEEEME